MTSFSELSRLGQQIGDLVESHEEARSLTEFAQYADDPVGFIRTELNGEPWPKQIEIAEAVRDHRQVVVRAGNGLGKDWLAARLALWAAYCLRSLVIVTGPTERQVKEIVFGEIRRAFAAAGHLPGELFELALRLDRSQHAGVLGFSSNDASRLTGFHAPSLFIFGTEAQGLDPLVYESALANATGSDSRILMVGNPLEPTGPFYRINRSANWHRIAISAFDHPNVKEGQEVIPGAVTRSFVEGIAQEYGESSGVYRSRVKGEFPEDSDEALVERDWLERSAERWAQNRQLDEAYPVFSVDPARFGADKTALAIRRGRRLLELVLWQKLSTMETVGRLLGHLVRYDVALPNLNQWAVPGANYRRVQECHVVVDVVGLGGGVVDRLTEHGYHVEAFNGGGAAEGSDRSRFFNARAEAFWVLRKLLEEDQVDLPPDELLWDELTSIRWKTNSTGKVQIEPKDLTRAQLGRSPDRADAVAMAFWLDVSRLNFLPPEYYEPVSYIDVPRRI